MTYFYNNVTALLKIMREVSTTEYVTISGDVLTPCFFATNVLIYITEINKSTRKGL